MQCLPALGLQVESIMLRALYHVTLQSGTVYFKEQCCHRAALGRQKVTSANCARLTHNPGSGRNCAAGGCNLP